MNWTVKKSPIASAGNVEKVVLVWQAYQLGDCLDFALPVNHTNESTNLASSFTVDTGLRWTRVRVSLTAVDSLGKRSAKTKTVLTAERPPNGTVLAFATQALRETSVNLTWSLPACVNRGGSLRRYLVNIRNAETGQPAKSGVTIVTHHYALTGLLPGTTYTAAIGFENSVGKGPEALFNFTMAGSSKCHLICVL